jgi:alpha-L-fucosidase 2
MCFRGRYYFLFLILFCFSATAEVQVDWPEFLARHDLVWEVLPTKFDHGAFHGNGLLGTTIYVDNVNQLRFDVGRSDVTDRSGNASRLPIGSMILKTAGNIRSGTLRTVLWDAETIGEIVTDQGRLRFRAMIHSDEIALLVDVEAEGGEQDATFIWEPEKAEVFQYVYLKKAFDANPPYVTGVDKGTGFCEQLRVTGGAYATAWQVQGPPSKRRLTLTVADSFPGLEAKADALATVRRVAETPMQKLEMSHRQWWHSYYPASFMSVPDAQVEGFYWIQMYKLASATREDRVVMDLMGPWCRETRWPRIWWNLNNQIAYAPVYTANHLELGRSLTEFFDVNRTNFFYNAKKFWGVDDAAYIPRTTSYNGLAFQKGQSPGDLTWALHNYWRQYRYSMDASLVTNHARHAFYPLLKGNANLLISLLKKGEDGKLHLPPLDSPEYNDGSGGVPDANYQLAMLRWGCKTLLELDSRYGFKDPMRSEWVRVLRDLTPYSQNEEGFMIGANQPVRKSHRHWSHMIMVWPLHLLSIDNPENKELVEKTIKHWMRIGNGKQMFGWSRAAASALYATLGNGDKALENLRAHHDNKQSVMPNTQYIEKWPVIECSLVTAKSLQDMLLQSWGGQIRVFPAVPAEWSEAVFHDWRAEGAFLISAVRRGGKTRWVRIKSLAGEPCLIRPGFDGDFSTSLTTATQREVEPGLFSITLEKNQEVYLFQEKDNFFQEIRACSLPRNQMNVFGLKGTNHDWPTVLSKGKPVRASTEYSDKYQASKVNDGDPYTRWAAAAKNRSGWLEIDLGKKQLIGRVDIWELSFPRIQKFVIEVQQGEVWQEIARGTTINGEKKIIFPPIEARLVRLTVKEASDIPTIEEFRVCAPPAL